MGVALADGCGLCQRPHAPQAGLALTPQQRQRRRQRQSRQQRQASRLHRAVLDGAPAASRTRVLQPAPALTGRSPHVQHMLGGREGGRCGLVAWLPTAALAGLEHRVCSQDVKKRGKGMDGRGAASPASAAAAPAPSARSPERAHKRSPAWRYLGLAALPHAAPPPPAAAQRPASQLRGAQPPRAQRYGLDSEGKAPPCDPLFSSVVASKNKRPG
jgi:hypothetical protein